MCVCVSNQELRCTSYASLPPSLLLVSSGVRVQPESFYCSFARLSSCHNVVFSSRHAGCFELEHNIRIVHPDERKKSYERPRSRSIFALIERVSASRLVHGIGRVWAVSRQDLVMTGSHGRGSCTPASFSLHGCDHFITTRMWMTPSLSCHSADIYH